MFEGDQLEKKAGDATWSGSGLPDDREALARLFERETVWLRGAVRSTVRSSIAGISWEDVIQECWLALLRKRREVNFESRRAFRSWLRTAARNCWLNRRRRLQEAEVVPDAVIDEQSVLEDSRSPRLRDLWGKRQSLPFRQDAVILLCDHCGCGYDRIAVLLSCRTPAAARGLRSRALEALAED